MSERMFDSLSIMPTGRDKKQVEVGVVRSWWIVGKKEESNV